MGHAHHFLSRLDRVSLQEVEFSLGLYNNPALLRYILARAGLPKGAERVAISLDDRNEGPFLIVTRDGRFVTCLARGMAHDLPLVRRWQLDLLAERHQELRAALRPAADVPENERAFYRMFSPIFTSGPHLSREEFLELSPWQPMMFDTYAAWSTEMSATLVHLYHELSPLTRPRPRDHARLKCYSDRLWALRHLYLLMGVGDPIEYFESEPRAVLEKITETLGHRAADECAFPTIAAGAWHSARIGGAYLPICSYRFEHSSAGTRQLLAALELSAIAGRHDALRDGIVAGFRAAATRTANDAADDDDHAQRRASAARVLRAFERTDDLDLRAATYGAELLFAQGHPAIERHGWRSPLEVPLDVARPVAAAHLCGWTSTPGAEATMHHLTPSIARYRPEDFYLPARWLREMRAPFNPDDTLKHLRMQRDFFDRREPVRAAKEPGRNDPCTCGSGAKYKKCCAVAPKPVAVEAPAPETPVATLADGIMPTPEKTATRNSLFPPPPPPEARAETTPETAEEIARDLDAADQDDEASRAA